MNLTGIKRWLRSTKRKDTGPDRVTQLLVGAAIILTAALTAIAADIWSSQESGQPAVQTARSVQVSPTPNPSALSVASATNAPAVMPTAGTPPRCVAPSNWGMHIVQRGDTLYSLALRYGTDTETLKQVNCLEDPTILIGQRLYVPGPLALPTFATPGPPGSTPLAPAGTPPSAASATPEAADSDVAQATPAPVVELPVTPLPVPVVTRGPRGAFRVNIPNRYMNIVLLGTDVRPHQRSDTWRTDTMIIVSIDVEDNVVRLLHLPRDLWVDIPGYGYDRINTAELWGELAEEGGGAETVKKTIYRNLGIPIHYYGRVTFQGFVDIIDKLGGLDIDVACPVPEIDLKPGMHHMDGEQTLLYARKRKSTNDYDRGRRQRKVLIALWDQILTPKIIPKIPQLWLTMADSFQTDLPLDQAINLASLGLRLEAQRILQTAITNKHTKPWTTPAGAMVLLPREEEIRTLLEEFYAPVDTTRVDVPNKVRVEVLKGWRRSEAEQLAAAELRRKGFRIVSKGKASRMDYDETQILVYRGDLSDGKRIARVLGVPLKAVQDYTTIPEPPDPSNPVDIRVVLGRDYDPCQR